VRTRFPFDEFPLPAQSFQVISMLVPVVAVVVRSGRHAHAHQVGEARATDERRCISDPAFPLPLLSHARSLFNALGEEGARACP